MHLGPHASPGTAGARPGGRRPSAVAFAVAVLLAGCAQTPSPSSTGAPPSNPPPAATSTAVPRTPTASTGHPAAALVVRGGPILTMTAAGTVAALAVRDGVIVAVGTEADVAPYIGPATSVLELDGRAVLPGFVDPHTHLLSDMGLSVLDAQQLALANGITSLADASVEPALLEQFRAVADQLVVRVGLYLGRTDVCGEDLGTWYEEFPSRTTFGDRLFVAGVKVFSDGGACRLVAASKSFVTGVDVGTPYFTEAALEGLVRTASEGGYQVLIHAQGDLAVRDAQDAIAAVLGGGPNELRHRIDHNSIVTAELRPRYGEIGIVPVVFGTFPTCADVAWTKFWRDNGEDWRSLLDANPGLPVAWHGDDPGVPPVSPLHDLASYVTRADTADDGSLCRPPPWLADNAISVDEALLMMTTHAAYAIGLEDSVGALEAGKLADFVVVTDDPTSVPADALFGLEVVATFVDGSGVYCRPGDEGICD